MRIREYIKTVEGINNNDVIEILAGKGIEGKTPASSISDEEIAIVEKELKARGLMGGQKAEAPKAEAPKAEARRAEEKAQEPKTEAPKAEEPKTAEPKKDTPVSGEAHKKKKKIVIVGQAASPASKPQGNQGGQDRRPVNNQNTNRPEQRGPIKPRTNMIDRAAEASARRENAEREENERLRREQEAHREEEKRQEREQAPAVNVQQPQRENIFRNRENNRPQGNNNNNNRRDGHENRQGGFNRDNRQGGGFNKDGNRKGGVIIAQGNVGGRGFNKPAKTQNGRFDAAPVTAENDRHRDKTNGKERDSRSKKDLLYEDDDMMMGKGRNSQAGRFQKPVKVKEEVVEDDIKVIVLPEMITIKDLADKMKIQPSAIVKKLFMQGKMVTVNQEISFEEAEEIALEYDIMCEQEEKVDVIAELLKEEEEPAESLVPRPPVICVMGHVDHGKTSLLDAIRKTNVTDKEAGGITQHIGAYTVNIDGKAITFLDTPGHEAFTSMRMRGANSTDIAILVVAADDGVMPQTVEAINHAKAAGIEVIVAVNKIDKPGANIDRVKQELTEYDLVAEDWGGQTIFAPVSAKTGQGIPELLEMILLTADVLELKANPKRKARGLVIEAELDKGRGPVATVLVQKGTLHVGDFISAGASHGKVRAMVDDRGRRVREALPSTPVEILGLNDVPNAGEVFICHDNDKQAKNYADTFIAQNKAKLLEETKSKMSLDELYSKIQEGNLKELNIIIKADVQGSVEAVKQSLVKLSNEEVVVKVIHGGVGAINESDVILASASNAIIIGFNVRPDAMAKSTAEREGVDVRLYKVIYQAIEDVEAAMKGMLDAVFEEKIIGHAEIQQIFKASAIGNIAGARVIDGCIQKDCKVRITREGEQIFEGPLASLKRFKDDVKEVKEGYECGLVFEGFDQMKELDIVEAYIMVEVPRE